jgi:hypothetical protein
MTYRWLTNDEIEKLVNPVLKLRGWSELNVNDSQPTCRVLGAFLEDGSLIESFTMQMYPVLGPLVRHDNEMRDAGETSRGLVAVMDDFLKEVDARDFLVVANEKITERLAQRFGMKKLEVPLYVKG